MPLAGMTAIAAGTASASPAATKYITCKALNGTVNLTSGATKITYGVCSGRTGTKGTSTGTISATTATVKWHNGKTTTFSTSMAAGTFTCPTGDIAEAISGTVTADTTGSASVGGAVSADVCFNATTGKVTKASGTVVKI